MYLNNRQKISTSETEYQRYNCLVESITIGIALLGEKHATLVNEISSIVNSAANHLGKRNMDYRTTARVYSCSSGTGDTGKITVRPEELNLAEESLLNQQASNIISLLIPLDRKIFFTLIKDGYIKKQKLDLGEMRERALKSILGEMNAE